MRIVTFGMFTNLTIDTWLLATVAATGALTAAMGVAGITLTVRTRHRDRKWRRLDRLAVPIGEWAEDIQVQTPRWIARVFSGDPRNTIVTEYQHAIRQTLGRRFTADADRFLADRVAYGHRCWTFREELARSCEQQTELLLYENHRYPSGLCLRPFFVNSIVMAAALRFNGEPIRRSEYSVTRSKYASEDRPKLEVALVLEWTERLGDSYRADIVGYNNRADETEDPAIEGQLAAVQAIHSMMMEGLVRHQEDQFDALWAEYGELSTRASSLRSQLAHMRAA